MTSGGVQVQPPPPEEDAWVRASERLRPQWQSLVAESRGISIPVSISRVDAARLDVEMSAMLKEQLVKDFSLMKSEQAWKDRALLLLRKFGTVFLVLEVSIYGLTFNLSPHSIDGVIPIRSLARWAWVFVKCIEGLYKAASFGNLLLFLYTGRYRNLIERALKARLVYDSPNMNRAVSFEYMNRQLVWNEFSVLLLLLKDQMRRCPFIPMPKMDGTGCYPAATQ